MSTNLELYGLMLLAGIGIPIMAGMNAQLGVRLGSPTAALVIIFIVGLSVSGLIAAFTQMPSVSQLKAVPIPFYFAGLLMVFYILSITYSAPHIGLGSAIFLVLLGQLISAAAIDHFGLFGNVVHTLEPRRIIGLIVMTIGVFLSVRL